MLREGLEQQGKWPPPRSHQAPCGCSMERSTLLAYYCSSLGEGDGSHNGVVAVQVGEVAGVGLSVSGVAARVF